MTTVLNNTQLLQAYDIVFNRTHSDVFKLSEMKLILYDNEYLFNESPNIGWYGDLIEYLLSIDYDCTRLKMNEQILTINL